MLGNEQAAAVADSQQADYFRGFLSGLRADLESDLAKQVRRFITSNMWAKAEEGCRASN